MDNPYHPWRPNDELERKIKALRVEIEQFKKERAQNDETVRLLRNQINTLTARLDDLIRDVRHNTWS